MQNYFPIATKINRSNVKKKANYLSAFDFSILRKTISHKLRLKVISEVINFVVKSTVRKRIGFSKHISIGLLRELEEDTKQNKLTKQTLVNKEMLFHSTGSMVFK